MFAKKIEKSQRAVESWCRTFDSQRSQMTIILKSKNLFFESIILVIESTFYSDCFSMKNYQKLDRAIENLNSSEAE